jgi:hypothetical protein
MTTTSVGLATEKQWHLFAWGGLATVCGEIVTLPIDVIKVRMQVQTMAYDHLTFKKNAIGSMSKTGLQIFWSEGVQAFYAGLSPAIVRQLFYGGLRTGFYEPIKQALNGFKKETVEEKISFINKVIAGALAGAVSAGICTPTDVIKIRMQAPNVFNNRYNGMTDATLKIIKKEGFTGLYKGGMSTSTRAAVIAATELSVYDECKHKVQKTKLIRDGFPTHLFASLMCGLVATAFAAPIDFLKTRLQSQPLSIHDGKGLYYKSACDCLVKTVKSEGVLSLWTGLWPHYLRRGPHLVVTFSVLEQLRYYGNKYL